MTAQFTDINAREFKLNGVRHLKTYVSIYYNNGIRVVGAYDSKLELLPSVNVSEVSVNGTIYTSVVDLSNALTPLLFSKNVSEIKVPTYQTKALLISEFAAPQENDSAIVINDPNNSLDGDYGYTGGAWVKGNETLAQANENRIGVNEGNITAAQNTANQGVADAATADAKAVAAQNTANDAKSRLNHTETQPASTISDFLAAVQAAETTTSLSLNANILKFTDENGLVTNLDLSLYLDDSNLARILSGIIDPVTNIATFTRDDNSTFTVDFTALNDKQGIIEAKELAQEGIDNAAIAQAMAIIF